MIRLSPLWLAIPATVTASCLSVLAGWQRGGWLPERLLWVAIGVVLVLSAHMLPALWRQASTPVRGVGGALWVACMATICYGHATFFLLAQQHAGDVRASIVTVPVTTVVSASHRLTRLAEDRASIITELADIAVHRCSTDCAAIRARRSALSARLDALTVAADQAKRQQTLDDRSQARQDAAEAARDAQRTDPVTGRVATFFGVAPDRVDLVSGLAFAAVLEGVACFAWLLALRSEECNSPVSGPLVLAPAPSSAEDASLTPSDELSRLIAEINSGTVRGTVAGIRKHLGCSQARAMDLRRRLPVGINGPAKFPEMTR